MNVLLIVTVFVAAMMLSTVGRLNSFLEFSWMRREINAYILNSETALINGSQQKHYDAKRDPRSDILKSSTEELQESATLEENDLEPELSYDEAKEKKKNEEASSNSKLQRYFNISSLFFDEKKKEKDSVRFDSTFSILKQLIDSLYSQEAFFKETEEIIPSLTETLLNAIISQTQGKKISKMDDLMSLDLCDERLQIVFTKILRGTKDEKYPERGGYPTLLKYIKLNLKKNDNLSIYLAPPELLMVIFQNQEVVEDVIQTREDLYRQVKRKAIKKEEASKEFAEKFTLKAKNLSLLDFAVTGTCPY